MVEIVASVVMAFGAVVVGYMQHILSKKMDVVQKQTVTDEGRSTAEILEEHSKLVGHLQTQLAEHTLQDDVNFAKLSAQVSYLAKEIT